MDISVQLTLAYSILALPLSLPFLSSPYLLKTWHLLLDHLTFALASRWSRLLFQVLTQRAASWRDLP